MMAPLDPRSSKATRFARSFQFPKRFEHVQPQPATEADPSARRDTEGRFQPFESPTAGRDQDHVWTHPHGKDLSRNVAESSGLDSLVRRTVREVGKGGASEGASLHQHHGGEGKR